MFNWQSSISGESSTRVVSSYFWIYWAFAIPLTIMVAFSWRLLLAWEKRHLDQDILLEIEHIEDSASLNVQTDKLDQEQLIPSDHILRRGWQSLRRRSGKQISTAKEM
jgi:hypothetical protein